MSSPPKKTQPKKKLIYNKESPLKIDAEKLERIRDPEDLFNFKPKKNAKRPLSNISKLNTMNGQGDEIDPNLEVEDLMKQCESIEPKKKKTSEDATMQTLRGNQEKIMELLKVQSETRKHMHDGLLKNFNSALAKYELELAQIQESDEKMKKQILAHQAKVAQQTKSAHTQNIKAIRDVFSTYTNKYADIERKHHNEHELLEEDITNHMLSLQEELLRNSRKERMEQLKKTLLFSLQQDLQ